MKIINDKGNARYVLNEGREKGLEFSFAEKKDKNTFELISPLTTCKDFLNDTLHAEVKKIKETFIKYSLVSYYKGFLEEEPPYIAIRWRGGYDEKLGKIEINKDNINNSLLFINKYEELLNLEKSTLEGNDEDIYLFKLNKFWIKTTYRLSFVTLAMRIGLFYNNTDIEDYLDNTYFPYDDNDMSKYLKLEVFSLLNKASYYDGLDVKMTPGAIHSVGIVYLYDKNIKNE